MPAVVILYDGSPTAIVNEVPETAKTATVLRLWLVAHGVNIKARKLYSAMWITSVSSFPLISQQAKEQTA
jgi:hypothetical protein